MPAKLAGKRTLRVYLEIGDGRGKKNKYSLKPLPANGGSAWKLLKLGMQNGKVLDVYEVHFEEESGFSCSCKGFAGYGYCKHSAALEAILRPLVTLKTNAEV